MQADVSKDTANVQKNNKLDNKLAKDSELALVVEAWPGLPEAIRSGIVAIVRASSEKDRGGR